MIQDLNRVKMLVRCGRGQRNGLKMSRNACSMYAHGHAQLDYVSCHCRNPHRSCLSRCQLFECSGQRGRAYSKGHGIKIARKKRIEDEIGVNEGGGAIDFSSDGDADG